MDAIACVAQGVARICGCEKPAVKSCSGGSCAFNPGGQNGGYNITKEEMAGRR